jgi:hypothetical protein
MTEERPMILDLPNLGVLADPIEHVETPTTDLLHPSDAELRLHGKFTGVLDLPPAEYHAAHAYLSFTGLKEFAKSPAHYQAYLRQESGREVIGTGVHMRVLEPERFHNLMVAVENRQTKANKEIVEAAEAEGKFVITTKEREKILRMSDAILSDPDCRAFLKGGKAEQSVFWTDPVTGVPMRCRPDYMRPDGIVIDLKYFNSVDEEEFRKQCARMKYGWQSVTYLDGMKYGAGIDNGQRMFVHIVVTDDDPFVARPFFLEDASLDLAEAQLRPKLEEYARCKATGEWPAFKRPAMGITGIQLPDWEFSKGVEA